MNKNPLTSANFDQTIANGVTLVDLWAPWCGYCRRIAPAVEALADELDGRIRVAGVNVDDAPDVAARFGVNHPHAAAVQGRPPAGPALCGTAFPGRHPGISVGQRRTVRQGGSHEQRG